MTKKIIKIIILLILLIALVILVVNLSNKDKKFYLEDKYYEEAKINEIDKNKGACTLVRTCSLLYYCSILFEEILIDRNAEGICENSQLVITYRPDYSGSLCLEIYLGCFLDCVDKTEGLIESLT